MLSGAGLDVHASAALDVHISAALDVHMGAETAEATADLLTRFSSRAFAAWSEEDKEKVPGVMEQIVRELAVPFTRASGSGVGIKLTGTIFVVRRRSGRAV